jgi:sugar (pentulose or hexulose) kinase
MMAGAKSRVPAARIVEPDRTAAAVYERLYPVYRQLAEVMAAPGSPCAG